MKGFVCSVLTAILICSVTLCVHAMWKRDGPVYSKSLVTITRDVADDDFIHIAEARATCSAGCAGFYNITARTAEEYSSTHQLVWFFGMALSDSRTAATINDNPNFNEDWATSSVGAHYVNENGVAISRWFSATTWDP